MKTLFTELFGSSPELRTLDFFLIHKRYDYSLTELSKNAGVGWTTINLFWPIWIKKGFVKKTRRIGRAQLYELNKENQFINEVISLHDRVLKDFLDEEIKKQKTKQRENLSSKNSIRAVV
jgi:hypothetical protein